jgi:hypothetical protein
VTDVEPLPAAFAHGDCEHPRPLLDALDHGFANVEADVHLVGNELLVGHDAEDLRPGRTLAALYLDPLRERVRRNGGFVYAQPTPFGLLIDVKTAAEPGYAALHRLLRSYADMLSLFRGGEVAAGPVTVLVSGGRSLATMRAQGERYAFYDGRLDEIGLDIPATLMPWISDDWTAHFRWHGEGPIPEEEAQRLRALARQAHAAGRKLRFWSTPDRPGPARTALWRELLAAGVDLLNTDDLGGLRAFLTIGERS